MIDDIVIPPDMASMPMWGTAQVKRLVPYSAAHIVKLAKDGKFPTPFTIGGKNFWKPVVVTSFLRAAMSKSEAKSAA